MAGQRSRDKDILWYQNKKASEEENDNAELRRINDPHSCQLCVEAVGTRSPVEGDEA